MSQPSAAPPRPNLVVVVLAFGGIVVSLMQTLVIPLIPQFPELLGASPGDTTWVITATLLASAVATPVVGRLGDMYGKRRMLADRRRRPSRPRFRRWFPRPARTIG